MTAVCQSATGWGEFVREYRDDLVRVVRARLRHNVCGSDAEDIVQEVLLRVTRNGARVQDVQHPLAYLRRAVVNECITRWRRQREMAVEELPEQFAPDHADRCVAQATVEAVMHRLTPRQRSVITLGYLHGYSDAEIAETLGVEPVTVRTLRRRALERMRLALQAQPPWSTSRSTVMRTITRTVPSGSVPNGRPSYFCANVPMSSRPPASDRETRPRISA